MSQIMFSYENIQFFPPFRLENGTIEITFLQIWVPLKFYNSDLGNTTQKLKISGYRYLVMDPAFFPFGQFPGIVTWRLKMVNFWVWLPRNQQSFGNDTQKLNNIWFFYMEISQLPNNDTWQ